MSYNKKSLIQYQDDSHGPIRVMNVTEARANFASVLKDAENTYIITKNSKPIRVILDYSDFIALQNQEEQGELISNLAVEELLQKQVPQRRKKSKNRVPGLLKEHVDLAKKQLQKKQPVHKALVIEEEAPLHEPSPPPQRPERPVVENIEVELPEENTEDYFGGADDYLMPPNEDPTESHVETAGLQEDNSDLLSPHAAIESEDVAAEEVERTPEEEAYYARYKKLYSQEDKQENKTDSGIEFQEEQNLETEEWQPEAEPQETFKQEEPQVEYIEPAKEPIQEEPVEQPSSPDELPSLKDLLKELEQEQLSTDGGDDWEDSDIDDLIERIKQD